MQSIISLKPLSMLSPWSQGLIPYVIPKLHISKPPIYMRAGRSCITIEIVMFLQKTWKQDIQQPDECYFHQYNGERPIPEGFSLPITIGHKINHGILMVDFSVIHEHKKSIIAMVVDDLEHHGAMVHFWQTKLLFNSKATLLCMILMTVHQEFKKS